MGFDDFFEHGNKHHKRGRDHHSNYQDDYHQSSPNYKHQDFKMIFLQKLQNNPQFKTMLIIGVIVFLVLIVFILALLFPLLFKMAQYVGENGIQGLINTLWNGTKK